MCSSICLVESYELQCRRSNNCISQSMHFIFQWNQILPAIARRNATLLDFVLAHTLAFNFCCCCCFLPILTATILLIIAKPLLFKTIECSTFLSFPAHAARNSNKIKQYIAFRYLLIFCIRLLVSFAWVSLSIFFLFSILFMNCSCCLALLWLFFSLFVSDPFLSPFTFITRLHFSGENAL